MPPELDLLRELNLEEALRVSEPYFKALYTSFKSPPRRPFSEQLTSGSLAGAPGEADDTSGLAEGAPPALKVWKKSPIRVRRRQRSADRRFADTHLGSNLPTNPAHRQITSFTAEDVLKEMDEAGVDAAVIHPPGWDPGADTMALEASPAPRPAVDSR